MSISRKVFGWLSKTSENHPIIVLSAVALITAFMIAGLLQIKQEYGERTMLSKDSAVVKAMEKAEENFGGTAEEQILIVSKAGLDGNIYQDVKNYETALSNSEGNWNRFIIGTYTPFDNMRIMQSEVAPDGTREFHPTENLLIERMMTLSKDELYEQVELNLEYEQRLAEEMGIPLVQQTISEDRTALLMRVRINSELENAETIKYIKQMQAEASDYFSERDDVEVHITGMASLNSDSSERTISETKYLFIIALVFMILVLFLTFRRISDVILTAAVILIAIVWVMGLSGWLKYPFTYTSTAMMPLLLGITIAYAIHVMLRYYEERKRGFDAKNAVRNASVTVGVAVFMTAATTAFAFASFGISNMPPIQHFGILCVFGVMVSFFLSISMLPSLIVIRDRREKSVRRQMKQDNKKSEKRDIFSFVDDSLIKLSLLAEHHRIVVFTATVLIVAVCIVLGFSISTEADVLKMLPQDMPSIVGMQKVNEYFGGQDMALTIVEGDILEPANLNALLEYQDKLSESDALSEEGERLFEREKMFSIADLIKQLNGEIPESKAEVIGFLIDLQKKSNSSGENQLITQDGGMALVTIRLSRGSQQDMKEIARVIEESSKEVMLSNTELNMQSSGIPLLINEMLGSILPTQLKTSGLALLLCSIIVIIVFRSLFFGLATVSVVFISVALQIGAIAILKWPLDFMTVMVSSLVIGAGIDFGIHITHRFREEWHYGGVDVYEATRNTIAHVGKALLSAAFTTAGAFAIIAFSDVDYMRRFGVVTALSLMFALISSLIVLPCLLSWKASRANNGGIQSIE